MGPSARPYEADTSPLRVKGVIQTIFNQVEAIVWKTPEGSSGLQDRSRIDPRRVAKTMMATRQKTAPGPFYELGPEPTQRANVAARSMRLAQLMPAPGRRNKNLIPRINSSI